MRILGIERLGPGEIQDELRKGAKFVIFTWCISLLVVTLKRGTDVYFVRAGEGTFGKHLPWTLLTFFVGWWGFPFGLIYTPMCLIQNLAGGKDVTAELAPVFLQATGAPAPPPPAGGLPPTSFGA